MKTTVIVPPIKCQGIKTKLVSSIKSLADQQNCERWIEPFCGSGVVAFNLQPKFLPIAYCLSASPNQEVNFVLVLNHILLPLVLRIKVVRFDRFPILLNHCDRG